MIYVSKVRMWLAEGAPCIHLILLLQCWGLLIEIYGISPSFQDQVKMRQKDCHFGTGCIETFFLTCLIRGRSSIFLRRGAPLWNDFNLISCFFFGRILLIIESHRSSGGGGVHSLHSSRKSDPAYSTLHPPPPPNMKLCSQKWLAYWNAAYN